MLNHVSGGQIFTQAEVTDLLKAMSIGYDRPRATGAGALVPEWLDGVLTSTLFDIKEYAQFYNNISKVPVTSNIVEYNKHTSRGDREMPFALAEGGAPGVTDDEYLRSYTQVKYVGVKGSVTDVAMQVQIKGSASNKAYEENTAHRTEQLLERVEDQLFWGDSSVESYEYDGLVSSIVTNADSDNVYDLKGQPITRDLLVSKTGTIWEEKKGKIQKWLMSGKTLADYSKSTLPYRGLNKLGETVYDNGKTAGLVTDWGRVDFESHFALRQWDSPTAIGIGASGDQPSTPATTSGPTDTPLAGSEVSYFETGDAGTYIYKIRAVGTKGASALLTTAGVTVTAGNKVVIVMNDAAVSDVRYYIVYRTTKGGAAGTARRIFRVAKAGSGATTITDFNEWRPYTSVVLGVNYSRKYMYFAELGKMLRIPLGRVQLSQEYILAMFGSPIFPVPTKFFMFKNVGLNA